MTHRIRIVSDVHLGHKASVVDDIKALRTLAEDVDWLIFNGDTLELKYGDLNADHYNAPEQKRLFDEETASWGCKVTLITGNHDPEISDIHSLSLLDGKVFVTHGDGLFPTVAPWSSNIKNLSKFAAEIDPNATGSTAQELHDYLGLHKKVSVLAHKDDKKYNPTLWGKLKIFLHQGWPPTTPFRIIKSWMEVPERAVSLTRRFGLSPKVIVTGHTHYPGVWKKGQQTVVNLGSLFPWPGSRCIDIEGSELTVRRIRKAENSLRIGKPVARFELEESAIGLETPAPA